MANALHPLETTSQIRDTYLRYLKTIYPFQEQDLRALEVRVEELIRACTHLKDENKTLRAQAEQLTSERDKLVESNASARARVEAMIDKLKTIEAEP